MLSYISIDPGVSNCGFSIVNVNTDNTTLHVLKTQNVRGTRKFTEAEKALAAQYGDRAVKVLAICAQASTYLDEHPEIRFIAIEAPFYNHLTPAAYGSLLEVIHALKYHVLIPRGIDFQLIEPMVVKKFFAQKAMAKKDLMKQSLIDHLSSGRVKLAEGVELESLSEHEIDAIAVAFTHQSRIGENHA